MRHVLLNNLIDYAGLFPPARLDMEPAVREYHAHLADPEAWMLGRFICPETRLAELKPFGGLFPDSSPLRLSVLPAGGASIGKRIAHAVQTSDGFERGFSGSASVEVFEARVADRLDAGALADTHQAAGRRMAYLEWDPGRADLRSCLEAVMTARVSGRTKLGVKIRCGGTEADAFPSVASVARFLHWCREFSLPFKATAGLHHPVRHQRGPFIMHGFLNVFVAYALDVVLNVDLETMEHIVGETDPNAFSLAEGGVRWRDLEASAQQLRSVSVLGNAYGSCSFKEPVDDLNEAAWFGAPDSV
ncbi:MAG: hypothetical protein JJ896_14645 [Rhodothermales bacterium]|nr:hypothetical protein [Rhodothermales bacterium]MBO6780890.1 hypothetical protein [Rhodothermales bacterium]